MILMVIGIPSSLTKQLLFLCSEGYFLQITLTQWAGVIMCLPSQLCQISIDQVSGKLKHVIMLITQFTKIRPK
jgi:hypothetical protein